MCTLVHCFDDPSSFPLIEALTVTLARVEPRPPHGECEAGLRVTLQRPAPDAEEARAVLALPPIAIHGQPERLLLDATGCTGECSVFLECADKWGWGFAYTLGKIDAPGPVTCEALVGCPSSYWGNRAKDHPGAPTSPIEACRLRIELTEVCTNAVIELHTLRVTGTVRLAPTAIASS